MADPGATALVTTAAKLDARKVAKLQREAEEHLATVHLVKVTSEGDYAFADVLLSDVHDREKTIKATKASATGPIREGLKVIDGWFKPVLDALEGTKRHLKSEMEAYLVRQKAAELEARALAKEAVKAGDSETLHAALTIASEPVKPAGTRASTGFRWVVKRIAEDLLPEEYWTPDLARIQEIAADAKGDDPPIVPGVIFERVARVGAR